jgi:PAS domain S-box-containing protein
MKDENKTKVELIKELKALREERGKGLFKDIAERKQIEETMQESEIRFRELFSYISSGVAVYEAKDNGKDFIIKDFNRASEKIEKVKKEDIVGKSVLKVFPGVKDFGLFKVFQEVYKTGKSQQCPISFYQDQRISGWRENYVYKLPSGEIVAVYEDITERKKAEEEISNLLRMIQEEKNKLSELINSISDEIWFTDLNKKFVLANPSALHEFKIDSVDSIDVEEFARNLEVYRPDMTPRPAEEAPPLRALRGELVKNQEEIVKVPSSGKLHYRQVSSTPVIDVSGNIIGAVSVVRDITERKKAEETLRESEQRFRDVIENTLEWVWEVDASGKYVYSSPVCEKILGYKPQELLEKHFYDLFVPEEQEQLKKIAFEAFANKQPFREFINLNIHRDGKLVWMSTSGVPILDKKGNLLGYRGVDMDITQRKQAEERLKKTRDTALEIMSKIIESKDPYTSGHQQRVCQLAIRIAQEMTLPEAKVEGIRIASLIHDIGKIGLPTEILSKPTKLSDIEFSLIKEHPQIGYDILKSNDFSHPVAQIILQHHERLNGSGYPNHLRGDEILLEACILGVADVVEAMSSHRPYRPALGIDKALEEISQNRGILYDPEVVDACLKLFKEKGFKFE